LLLVGSQRAERWYFEAKVGHGMTLEEFWNNFDSDFHELTIKIEEMKNAINSPAWIFVPIDCRYETERKLEKMRKRRLGMLDYARASNHRIKYDEF
jgi:hypothetical protein